MVRACMHTHTRCRSVSQPSPAVRTVGTALSDNQRFHQAVVQLDVEIHPCILPTTQQISGWLAITTVACLSLGLHIHSHCGRSVWSVARLRILIYTYHRRTKWAEGSGWNGVLLWNNGRCCNSNLFEMEIPSASKPSCRWVAQAQIDR